MNATNFEQANKDWGKPEGWKDEECYSLPTLTYRGKLPTGREIPMILSCWQPTPEDLERLKNGGKIWVNITAAVQVPMAVFTEDPFTIMTKIDSDAEHTEIGTSELRAGDTQECTDTR